MPLQLFFHPLSSYCQKVLSALYENDTPFEARLVNLGDEASAGAFRSLWPIGKMPVLRDEARDRTIPESSIIIEYLGQHYPGRTALIPADPELALRTRLADRFYDLYVHDPMQRIVGDRLRPADRRDPYGVDAAKAALRKAYDIIDADMAGRSWASSPWPTAPPARRCSLPTSWCRSATTIATSPPTSSDCRGGRRTRGRSAKRRRS
jgi:glutathione S-transferase